MAKKSLVIKQRRPQEDLEARPPGLRAQGSPAARPRGDGHGDPLDVERPRHEPHGGRAGNRRRGHLLRLVARVMSRIGNRPIELPSSVSVALSPGRVQVNGPLGELSQQVPTRMKIEQRDGELVVSRPSERGEDRALHGLTRSLVANMVEGVTKGFEKRLEAQRVDDLAGRTLAAANWLHLKKFKGTKTEQAAEVGKLLAANAKKAGLERVVFDRGGYLYHGRVKALADASREGGLKF